MTWDYKHVDQLVINYQNREPLASDKLIEAFDGFINKYYEVIVNGKIYLNNPSIRTFIGMFSNREDYRNNMYKYKHAPTVVRKAKSCVKYIHHTFNIYEDEEIKSILISDFLEIANKYKPIDENPRFHSYLLKSYHYKVYHTLMKACKDPLFHCRTQGMYLNENDLELAVYDNYNLNNVAENQRFLVTENDNYVDDNWVAGFTTDIFSEYSPVDRKILKLKYIDTLTDGDIADKLSVCRATINRRRIRVESDVKYNLLENNMLKEN